jgi:hypothetical protein
MEGTAVIATSPDGHVQGCEVDFDQSKPAGFDLQDAQAQRARIRLSGRIIKDHCSGHIARALTRDNYMAERVMDRLRDDGWRFDVRPISVNSGEGQSDG